MFCCCFDGSGCGVSNCFHGTSSTTAGWGIDIGVGVSVGIGVVGSLEEGCPSTSRGLRYIWCVTALAVLHWTSRGSDACAIVTRV